MACPMGAETRSCEGWELVTALTELTPSLDFLGRSL